MIQIMNVNYKKAYSELNEILKVLSEKEQKKIPVELIRNVEANRDIEYKREYDASKELLDQELMAETKALLVAIYQKYLCTDDENEFWERYNKRCFDMVGENKSTTNMLKNRKKTEKNENLSLIVKRESLINKAIRFIKEILNSNTVTQE